jgi:hypothetical protein
MGQPTAGGQGLAGSGPAEPSTPIGRVASAIDQLASDVLARSGSPEHAARVADIWLMITVLDPEIARLTRRYMEPSAPADGSDLS